MRDWSDVDLTYSGNDATHPRNRPAGAGAADPVKVSAAVRSATARVLAAGVAAQLRSGRVAGSGTSMPGPVASAAGRHPGTAAADLPDGHKEAALDMFNRVRDRHRAGMLAYPVEALAAEFDRLASRPGKVCPYW